jgi:molecular chaperone DnaK (HSP70)
VSNGLGDEAIVVGAAMYAAILAGDDMSDIGCCIDIQPVSLGIVRDSKRNVP